VKEAEWNGCADPTPMLGFLRGKASQRKVQLFAVACVRTVWELLPDESTRRAVQLTELAADGQVDPLEQRKVLQELVPQVNRQYSDFVCGGCEGPGSIFAAMAVTALNHPQTFTWYLGQTAAETYTAWECVAMARAWTAKEQQRRKSADYDDEPDATWYEPIENAGYLTWDWELAIARTALCALLRDLFGPLPFREVRIEPAWRAWNDGAIVRLAEAAYEHREMPSGALDNARLGILADALEESGCSDLELISHLRSPGIHVRGCFAVDAVLGKS